MKEQFEFYECQRYASKIWYACLIIGINIPFVWGFVQQIILGKPWGDNPMSDVGFIITMLLIFSFSILMLLSNLKTIINSEGVYIKYIPFQRKYKLFPWEDIKRAEVKRYSPLKDFGGWGIRSSFGKKAYNVYGNMGLVLEMSNGKKIVIGTQRSEEMGELLENKEKNDLKSRAW